MDTLNAISPLDGRYWNTVKGLSKFFSEYGLIRFRVQVEVEYFIALCKLPLPMLKDFNPEYFPRLREVYENFNEEKAKRVKQIEATTNHDVKAVEYFIKESLDGQIENWDSVKEFIHFGLTSQDINNTAIPYSLKCAIDQEYVPSLEKLLENLKTLALQYQEVPLLARTHGQAATPTRVGKELMVFVERLHRQLSILKKTELTAKFGGATGQFNAHFVAFPNIDWPTFGDNFVSEALGLVREQYTTQISHYDQLGAVFDAMKRVNVILIDLCRDMWTYISMDYFKLKVNENEVGSSAMPHKVNPIDFENAEGNCGIANALFDHFTSKLPISRLQRDLSDSTVLRNLGVPIGHSLLTFSSLNRGLGKITLNEVKIKEDLHNNWIVIAEAIQTVLRREGFANPYEELKRLTRGKDISAENMDEIIEQLNVSQSVKDELKLITPFNFIGVLPSKKQDFLQ